MLKSPTADEKVDTLLSTGQIPIIDLAPNGSDQQAIINGVAVQLQKALSEKGIVFLVNHEICAEKMQKAWSFFDQFCHLPDDIKTAYNRMENNNHGYVKPGVLQLNSTNELELRHSFDITTLQENKLPEGQLPGFRDHICELAGELKGLTRMLLQALAIGMDLDQQYFLKNHSHMLSGMNENGTALRMIYYPPIEETSAAKERNKPTIRCGAHCDFGTFTLLTQDSEGGLEVKLPGSDEWKRVGHLPGAILLNSGEILSKWTENRYPALWHRVIAPPQVSLRSRGRHSMAFFCHPDHSTTVEPLKHRDIQSSSVEPFNVANQGNVTTAYQFLQEKFRKTFVFKN